MKKLPVLLACVSLQFLAPSFVSASPNEPAPNPGQAADLAHQADDKLNQANTPDQYRDAARLLQESVALDPSNLDVQFKLGWLYLDKIHDPHAAYPYLSRVAKRRPDDVDSVKMFALSCSQSGRMDQAVVEFRKATMLAPNDLWIRANLARSLARTGHWHEADKIYNEILKTDPNNEEARLGQAELEAWRGRTGKPLEILKGVITQDPTNSEALVLRGDLERWNWDLTDSEHDYRQAMSVTPNAYGAQKGLDEAEFMGSPTATVSTYGFKDKTDFGRYSAGLDARVPLSDHAFLTAGGAGWRFTNPGFESLDRVNGNAGLEYDWNRYLATTVEGNSFNNLSYLGHESSWVGAQATAKISPLPGSDIYLTGGYNQPFDSSILTVTNGMKQNIGGMGLNIKLPANFSVQNSLEVAGVEDGNGWWEDKPQISYQLFDYPLTFLRVQYDFLHYSRTVSNYWSPGNWRVLSPAVSTSLPIIGQKFRIDVDASAPYVLNVSRFGYQATGGPALQLGSHVEAKAEGIAAYVPGNQVTWSGYGWQAYLKVRF